MSLHYLVKREMLIMHVLPLSCYRKKLPDLSYLNCGLQLRQIWIQLLQYVRTTAREGVTKHTSLIWAHWNSDWQPSGPSWIMSSFRQPFISGVVDSSSQISDECFVQLLLQYFPHEVINWIQIWRIWRLQTRWDQFWSFFLQQLNGSKCAMSISSFTR